MLKSILNILFVNFLIQILLVDNGNGRLIPAGGYDFPVILGERAGAVKTAKIRLAWLIRSLARWTPMRSTGSSVARMPGGIRQPEGGCRPQ